MPTMTITMSDEINDALERIAERNGISKGEAMRKALCLLVIADRVKWENESLKLGIVRKNSDDTHKVESIIIGM